MNEPKEISIEFIFPPNCLACAWDYPLCKYSKANAKLKADNGIKLKRPFWCELKKHECIKICNNQIEDEFEEALNKDMREAVKEIYRHIEENEKAMRAFSEYWERRYGDKYG